MLCRIPYEEETILTYYKLILSRLGIDTNVGWTLIGRLASIIAGFASIIPVTHFLSATQQGYYYTFASITAIQQLFELGMTQILVQMTSHEFPFVANGRASDILQEEPHTKRLTYLGAFANRWYLVMSLLFATSLVIGGTLYFLKFGSLNFREWQPPWTALILLTAANLFLSPRLAFVEGAGHTGKVAALRLFQTVAGYILLGITLWSGAALWAAIALPLVQTIFTTWWLRYRITIPDFFRPSARAKSIPEPLLRKEILSLQWRVALSWIGGYLSTLVFTPLIFAFQGAAAAGRWGLSFSALSQVSAMGMSFVTARTPRFGELIARGERQQLRREFNDAAQKTIVLVSLGCCTFIASAYFIDRLGYSIAARVLPPLDLALMAAATIGAAAVFCFATFIRAHKEEPLAPSSLVIGLATILLAWIGAHFNVTFVATAYMAMTVFVSVPWRYAIYRRYRDLVKVNQRAEPGP